MADSMIPVLRIFIDAYGDRARARILLVVPDAVLLKYRSQFEAACRRAGFQIGIDFIACRRAAFHATRRADGVLAHEPFETMRAALAEFCEVEP